MVSLKSIKGSSIYIIIQLIRMSYLGSKGVLHRNMIYVLDKTSAGGMANNISPRNFYMEQTNPSEKSKHNKPFNEKGNNAVGNIELIVYFSTVHDPKNRKILTEFMNLSATEETDKYVYKIYLTTKKPTNIEKISIPRSVNKTRRAVDLFFNYYMQGGGRYKNYNRKESN